MLNDLEEKLIFNYDLYKNLFEIGTTWVSTINEFPFNEKRKITAMVFYNFLIILPTLIFCNILPNLLTINTDSYS